MPFLSKQLSCMARLCSYRRYNCRALVLFYISGMEHDRAIDRMWHPLSAMLYHLAVSPGIHGSFHAGLSFWSCRSLFRLLLPGRWRTRTVDLPTHTWLAMSYSVISACTMCREFHIHGMSQWDFPLHIGNPTFVASS